MKIRMVQERTGPRHDGQQWPPVGGEITVDGEEGAAVCGAGWAVPVPEERKAEKADAPPAEERKAETRPAPDTAEKRTAHPAAAKGKG